MKKTNTGRTVLGLALLIISLFSTKSVSQSLAFDLLNGKEKITIPFDYTLGYIVLDVKFHNALPLKFIFDTGSENVILFQKEMAEILQIPYDKMVKVQGADLKNVIDAYIYRGVFLKVEELENVKRDIVVLEEDIMQLQKYIGTPIHGILGTSFFKGLILEIDYRSNELVLYDSRSFDKSTLKGFKEVDIDMVQSKAYIDCYLKFNNESEQHVRLLLDTGAGISILLYDDQQDEEDAIIIPTGHMGNVVSGTLRGYLGKVEELSFGDFKFTNLISNLIQQDSVIRDRLKLSIRKGLIGNVILSRFDIIIDYLDDKLYLKPHRKYNKEFGFDKSGLELFATSERLNKIYVNHVIEYSPAYFAGIKKGDILTRVNGRSTKSRGLVGVSNVFSEKIGAKIKLDLLRDGEKISKQFYLFDFLSPLKENYKYLWFSESRMEVY